jgi:hypothetical protein
MKEYHVVFDTADPENPRIYAGMPTEDMTSWTKRSDATEESLVAAALYLLKTGETLNFKHGGKSYQMTVTPGDTPDCL